MPVLPSLGEDCTGLRMQIVSGPSRCSGANQQLGGSRRKLDPNLALRVPWTKAEDAKLLALQESHGNHWADMAKHLKGRNAQMCRTRQAPSTTIWPSCHTDSYIVHTPNTSDHSVLSHH